MIGLEGNVKLVGYIRDPNSKFFGKFWNILTENFGNFPKFSECKKVYCTYVKKRRKLNYNRGQSGQK